MNKYYVKFGELERVLMAESPMSAAFKAAMNAQGETLGLFAYVSEHGYRPILNPDNSDVWTFDTDHLPEYIFPYEDIIQEY